MLILIEGMDNTGKTTLAHNIIASLPHFIYHHNEKPASREDAFANIVSLIERASNKDIVCDRCCVIGEEVYGTVLRGKSLFKPYETNILMKMLSTVTIMNILCKPPIQAVIESMGERAQMEGVAENAYKLYDTYVSFYHNFWKTAVNNVEIWNYRSPNKDEKFKFLIKSIQTQQVLYQAAGRFRLPVSLPSAIDMIHWEI